MLSRCKKDGHVKSVKVTARLHHASNASSQRVDTRTECEKNGVTVAAGMAISPVHAKAQAEAGVHPMACGAQRGAEAQITVKDSAAFRPKAIPGHEVTGGLGRCTAPEN